MFLLFIDIVDILLENSSEDQRNRSECHIVQRNIPVIEYCLSRISIENGYEELRQGKKHILVDEIHNHLADTDISPSSMNQ